MSDDVPFRCPVCRASQTLQQTCRRCQADLSLVVRVHRRLEYVKRRQAEFLAQGDLAQARQFAAELRWLAPMTGNSSPAP